MPLKATADMASSNKTKIKSIGALRIKAGGARILTARQDSIIVEAARMRSGLAIRLYTACGGSKLAQTAKKEQT